ncbi:hypothetical protein H5187_24090, partial [Pseudoalteromonas sp. SG44-1]|uniref:hypothetical protein n=1 Tax=Pseudoalteromonas sp. SG44-1 TaxID=2760964 RepID=UPI0016022821
TPLNTAATASTAQADATQQVTEPTQPKADSAQAGSESSLNADQADNSQNVKATDVGTGNAPLNTASTAQANATQQVNEPTQPKADNAQADIDNSLNDVQADNAQNVNDAEVNTGNTPL